MNAKPKKEQANNNNNSNRTRSQSRGRSRTKKDKRPVSVTRRNNQPMQKNVEHESYGSQLSNVMQKGYGKTLEMYPGTLQFAKVYADPFSTDGARIPVFPIVSSQLERIYATGKGTTNGDGNGWVSAIPLSFASNNVASVFYSNGSSGNEISDTPQTATSSSPHDIGSFYEDSGSYTVRPVSFGIRCRYIGTTLNAAGTILAAQIAPLGNSMAGLKYNEVKQLPSLKEYTFKDSSWHAVCRQIETVQDTGFTAFDQTTSKWIYPDSTAESFDGLERIAMYFAAQPNTPFEWEVVGHYEFYGTRLTRRGVTVPDTPGFEHVVGSLAKLRHQDSTTKDHNVGGTWSHIVGFLKKTAKAVLPVATNVLEKFLI